MSSPLPSPRFNPGARALGVAALVALAAACTDSPTQPSPAAAHVPRPRSEQTTIGPVDLSPEGVSFDGQLAGTESPPETVRIRNIGLSDLTITSLSITGFDSAAFALDTQTDTPCRVGTPIKPDSSCQVRVTFRPARMGIHYAAVSIEHTTGAATILLEGLGTLAADLGVTATASVLSGKTVAYRITVKNDGPGYATGITVTDSLPPTATFVSIAGRQDIACTVPNEGAGGMVSCVLGLLPSGASADIAVQVKAGPGSRNSLTNVITVSSASYDPAPGNNQAKLTTSLNGKK